MSERTAANEPCKVVIVGGGVAGLEALIALHAHAGNSVAVTLVSRDDSFLDRPRTVAEPFGLAAVARYPLAQIAAEFDARFIHATVTAVAGGERRVTCADGSSLEYDTLILATGARPQPAPAGAIAFGLAGSAQELEQLLGELRSGAVRSVAFVAPSASGWLLPLYELALMTSRELSRARVDGAGLQFVTPERRPLALFGEQCSDSVAGLLAAAGVQFAGGAPATVGDGAVVLAPGESVAFDAIVTLPLLRGPGLAGVPATGAGEFIPVDAHGRVRGLADVYAAGDAVDFDVKQGGLAAQQADAVAAHVAARHGADVQAAAFAPILRGMLFTGSEPRYLRADVPEADPDVRGAGYPLWWPPTKIAGRYLAPYLWARGEVEPPGRPPAGFIDVDISLTASTWPG